MVGSYKGNGGSPMKGFLKIARLSIFVILSGLLMYMGHFPNTWEFWSVIACTGLIGISEYFDKYK